MENDKVIKVGTAVPDFILKDQNDQEVKLSDLRGRKVLLSFHPMAWTSVCAEQMKSLEANFDEFEKLNTVPIGISIDTIPTKKAWAKELGLNKTSLLSDFWPHGSVARSLGLFHEKLGVSERANVLIDEQGKVSAIKVYPMKELPSIEEILEMVKDLDK